MDDLIITGTAGIVGLFVAGIVIFVIAVMVVLRIVHAFTDGDYRLVFEVMTGIIVIAAIYFGIGWWLQKTDRI
jgi:hypothetical protein